MSIRYWLIAALMATGVLGQAEAKPLKQSALDRISDKCGLDRSALRLIGADTVQFQPNFETKFEAIDCALAEIKKARFPNMKMGFLGNDNEDLEKNNAEKN